MRLCEMVWFDTNDPAAALLKVIPTKAFPAPANKQYELH